MKRKLTRVTCAALCAAMTLSCAVTAYAGGSTRKEEAVYVNLDYDGSVRGVYVVNTFDMKAPGVFRDYGKYSSIKNLTSTDMLRHVNGEISLEVPAGKFSYQGNCASKETPWLINVEYTLDGKKKQGGELAGSSGRLGIDLSVKKNPAVDPVYFDNFAVQITVQFDGDTTGDITAEHATMAAVGNARQLSYIILPGNEKNFHIEADVRDFEMAGIQLNGISLALDIDDPDTDELMDQVYELQDGAVDLDDGVSDLNEGAEKLSDGTKDLAEGAADLDSGVVELLGGARDLSDGAQQLSSGVSDLHAGTLTLADGVGALDSGAVQLNDGAGKLYNGTGTLLDGVATLQNGAVQLLDGAQKAVDGCFDIASGSNTVYNGLGQLNTNTPALMDASNQLAAGTKLLYDTLIASASDLPVKAGQLAAASTQFKAALNGDNDDGQMYVDQTGATQPSAVYVINGAKTAIDGLDNAATAAAGLSAFSTNLDSQAALARGNINTISNNLSELDALPIDVKTAIIDLTTSAASMCEMVASDTSLTGGNVYSISKGLDAGLNAAGAQQQRAALKGGLESYASQTSGLPASYRAMDAGIQQLNAALNPAGGGGLLSTLIDNVKLLSDNMALFNGKLGEYTGGVVKLFNNYGTLNSGIATLYSGLVTLRDGVIELTRGVDKLLTGAFDLNTGAKDLYDGTGDLASGAGDLYNGANDLAGGAGTLLNGSMDLADGSAALYNGVTTLSDGTVSMFNGANDLSSGAYELYDGTVELYDGTTELRDKTSTMDQDVDDKIDEMLDKYRSSDYVLVSFASPKNTDIKSVQFAMKTPAIELPDKDTDKAEEQAPSLWQKVLDVVMFWKKWGKDE